MKRQAVDSSNLVSVGYDPENQILEIEFHGGRVYRYSGVPSDVHQALMSASSHGKYFNSHIRGAFSYTQVS